MTERTYSNNLSRALRWLTVVFFTSTPKSTAMAEHSGRTPKVERVVEKYDLDGLGDELEARWTTEGDDRLGLRDLAERVNHAVVEAALDRAGVDTLDGEVENVHRLLTDDDVSGGVRIETRRLLERNGVDVEALEADMVTHQAVHTYLTKYRDASLDTGSDAEQIEKDRQRLDRLRAKLSAVTGDTVDRLDRTDRIAVGEFDVFVDVDVLCRDCSTQYAVGELLRDGGCDCPE